MDNTRHDGLGDDGDATETERVAARETLFAHSTARLSDDDRDTLDSDLSADDFVTAIKSMSPYKAPGYDGIPAKVYQLAPELFARILLRVFQYQTQHDIMAPDQRRSLACLLFKKGDRSNPGNYRPISLIPVDVKIFARALTNRLRPMMNPLIHRDQSGFVKGRHIQHPLLTLYDLRERVTQLGREAYATMIDFEKAYDRVNWDYLWAVLRHFNFGENFVRWVKLLYTSTEVCLNVNGNILDAIQPTRGVKQGDPLSPLLFILALEPLCCAIRANATAGLHLPGLPTATGMYFADDATLLSDSLSGATQQLELVQLYCTSSGARLNIGKTTILPLNRNQTRHADSDVRVLGPDERVRYLGLPVGQRVFHNDRLSTINTKFYSQFSIWKWRAKTLQGRIIVAQALMASQLWYCSAVTCIPPKLVTDWQRALNNYIVRAQTEQTKDPLMIASDWLYATPGRTTLRLPNVDRFIKRQHLNLLQQLVCARTYHSECFGWYSIPLSQLMALQSPNETSKTVDFLWMALSRKRLTDHPDNLNSWWIEVMMTWKAWTKTLNLETLPAPERQRVYLTAPPWDNRYQLWQYRTNSATRSLWRTSAPLVRHSLATKGFSTLQDFLTPDLQWPTLDVFAATVFTATELPTPQTRNIAFLYGQLTQIFDRLFPRGVDTTLLETPHAQLRPLWPWRVSTPLKTLWFPKIPSKALYTSLADSREPTKTHPFQRHVLIDAPSTTQLQNHARYLRKFITPRTLDVTIRVWWRILPVHYFFWRQGDQALRYCVHGCNDIESYHHLFWHCTHSSRLWRPVLQQWQPVLDRPVTWNQALFGLDLSLKHRWKQHSRGILIAWNITRSIVFSLLWQNRNLRKHQQEEPPDPRSQWHLIDNRLRIHLRHTLHRAIAADDTELRNSLIRIVSILATSPFQGT
ncbi:putative Pollike protein [Globisporangium polare]